MDELKKMSASALVRIADKSLTQYKYINWHSTSLAVRKMLPVEDYHRIMRVIIDNCRDENGRITLELLDFSTRINIISFYALVEVPRNLEDLYLIVYGTDLYETICNVVEKKQIESIKNTAKLLVMQEVAYGSRN